MTWWARDWQLFDDDLWPISEMELFWAGVVPVWPGWTSTGHDIWGKVYHVSSNFLIQGTCCVPGNTDKFRDELYWKCFETFCFDLIFQGLIWFVDGCSEKESTMRDLVWLYRPCSKNEEAFEGPFGATLTRFTGLGWSYQWPSTNRDLDDWWAWVDSICNCV